MIKDYITAKERLTFRRSYKKIIINIFILNIFILLIFLSLIFI